MKKLYMLGFWAALFFATTACKDELREVTPTNISNLRAEPCEGGIILRWDVPEDQNYLYVRVEFQHPVTGQQIKKNVSVYQDSLLIGGLLAKDGVFDFRISSVSGTETQSESNAISAKALPVQPKKTKRTQVVPLSVENVSSNKPEASEGPISNLVNGNYKDFFHSDWHNPGDVPHYIDIALMEPLEEFEIITWYRNGKYGQCPTEITVLGSNDGKAWEIIGNLADTGAGKDRYTTPVLGKAGKPYRYIRYRADVNSWDNVFFALAELQLNKVWYEIYDPEGIYQP